jgi:hypothetical protein
MAQEFDKNYLYYRIARAGSPYIKEKANPMSPLLGAGVGAAGAGLTAAALSPLLRNSRTRITPALVVSGLLGGAAVGAAMPLMFQKARLQRLGEISEEEAMMAINDAVNKDLTETPMEPLEKSAGSITLEALRFAGKALRYGGVGAGLAGKTLWQGVRGGGNLPERAWSLVARGGVTGGLGYGAYRGARSLAEAPKPRATYATMLRNNIISGRLGPGNLSQTDLVNVRKMGMQ